MYISVIEIRDGVVYGNNLFIKKEKETDTEWVGRAEAFFLGKCRSLNSELTDEDNEDLLDGGWFEHGNVGLALNWPVIDEGEPDGNSDVSG